MYFHQVLKTYYPIELNQLLMYQNIVKYYFGNPLSQLSCLTEILKILYSVKTI